MRWRTEKLAYLLDTLESGGRPRGGASLDSDGVPSLGGEHIGNDGEPILDSMKFIPRSYYETLNQGRIKKGDILIVKDGATTGKTAFVGENFPYEDAAVNEHVFIVRVNRNRLVPKYAFYWLFSPRGNRQILSDFRGSAQGGISRSFVNQVHIPVPPLDEQRRIVEILDEADRLRKLRRQADAIAERILPALFYKMFGDPVRAEKKSIQALIDEGRIIVHKDGNFGSDYPRETDFGSEGVPFLSATYIDESGFVHLDDLPRLNQSKAKTLKFGWVQNGDVLLAHNATVGRVGVLEDATEPMLIGTSLTCYRTDGELLNPYYLYGALLTADFQQQLKSVMGQGTRNQVPITMQRKLTVQIAKPERQKIFGNTVRVLRDTLRGSANSRMELERLFQTLLHRAFTGELTKRWREENAIHQIREGHEEHG